MVCFPATPQLLLSLTGLSPWVGTLRGSTRAWGAGAGLVSQPGPGSSFSSSSAPRTVCAATCWPGLPLSCHSPAPTRVWGGPTQVWAGQALPSQGYPATERSQVQPLCLPHILGWADLSTKDCGLSLPGARAACQPRPQGLGQAGVGESAAVEELQGCPGICLGGWAWSEGSKQVVSRLERAVRALCQGLRVNTRLGWPLVHRASGEVNSCTHPSGPG